MADKKKIYIRVTPEEYELIALNASTSGMTLNGYVKRVAIDRIIVLNNYDAIMESTREIRKVRREIQTIISSAIKSEHIYRADIKAVDDRLREIEELERKMLQQTERDRESIRKQVRAILEEQSKQKGGPGKDEN